VVAEDMRGLGYEEEQVDLVLGFYAFCYSVRGFVRSGDTGEYLLGGEKGSLGQEARGFGV
jgi:hypothetical protein